MADNNLESLIASILIQPLAARERSDRIRLNRFVCGKTFCDQYDILSKEIAGANAVAKDCVLRCASVPTTAKYKALASGLDAYWVQYCQAQTRNNHVCIEVADHLTEYGTQAERADFLKALIKQQRGTQEDQRAVYYGLHRANIAKVASQQKAEIAKISNSQTTKMVKS